MNSNTVDPSKFDPAALFRVNGLVAVVTGAGSGIGRSIALALAYNGAARVYLLGRRFEKLQETAALGSDRTAAGVMVPLRVDVMQKDELASAAAQIAADVGFVHLVVVNAGVTGPNLLGIGTLTPSPGQLQNYIFNEWSDENFTRPFATNVTGAFFTCAAFLDLLDKGNSETNRLPGVSSQVIVNSSAVAYVRQLAGSGAVAYATSKAAVNQMFKILSTLFVPYRIRVNLLNLGVFPTEMTAPLLSDDKSGLSANNIPERRFGDDADLAGAALYLASRAGAYVNGLSLIVDGGLVAVLPGTY
ncbi:short chain dehydrogenase/reductase family [Pyricularia oryzae]|uniref:Short chain dehydrogenase/reductase family n=2 Tax=Pyricularia oryzae TaxID=318829 RepID=A0AA97P8M3_PYRO3|nr:short chain dehydrogenase/reductase family [Pyricularia oryzae Y34]KAI7914194.1 short chain dehydrogenase/reductase family [Pyricularia oryzae]KAI7916126.1 short chain dehydrogenase/reductase family [Pyricularia oryzae]